MILSVPFCPYDFVRTILSPTICPRTISVITPKRKQHSNYINIIFAEQWKVLLIERLPVHVPYYGVI